MALKSLIFRPAKQVKNKDGSKKDIPAGIYLNALKRFALSGIAVPSQDLAIAKIPAAASTTQPGRSPLIPIVGPADGFFELFSFTGKQNVKFQGIGVITTTGGNTTVTGVGTKFTRQLQVGDTIATAAGTETIATITSDTLATTAGNMAANTLQNYFFVTSSSNAIQRNVFVTIQDQGWRRMLMNRDVPVYHVFGSNTKPEFIKESVLLETDQPLLLQFLNYSTAGRASFAPVCEGRKWQYEAMKYPEVNNFIAGLRDRKQFLQPYWLTLDNGWASLGASSSATGSAISFLTATGDITIVLFNLYAQAFDASGVDVSSNVTVQFMDAKTMRSMQYAPMPLNCCAGTAENPFRLSSPWIIEPQTQIQCTFKNLAASACTVYMTFHGVAAYTGSSWHGSTLTNKNLENEAGKMYRAMSTPQIRPASPQ